MKAWKRNLAPLLFAFAGLLWLLPTVKQFINGDEIRGIFIVIALMCFALAVASQRRAAGMAAQRKAEANSGPPSADPSVPRSL